MDSSTYDIRVPGAAYYEALDPLATQVPGELELPTPTRKAQGKGASYFYTGLTRFQAEEVAEHLIDYGYTLLGDVEPEERNALRTCVQTGMRIRAQLKDADHRRMLEGATGAGFLNLSTGRIER